MGDRLRVRGHGRGNGRDRGNQYSVGNPYGSTKKRKMLCATLGEILFTYSGKGAAEQIIKTLKKVVKQIGTIYGQDIRNEHHNRKVVSIDKIKRTLAVLDHNQDRWY